MVVYVPATSALDDTFDLLRSVGASELNPRSTDDAWFSKGAILDQLGRAAYQPLPIGFWSYDVHVGVWLLPGKQEGRVVEIDCQR